MVSNLVLLANKMQNDQHGAPAGGIAGVIFVVAVIWLLMSAGGGPKK